MNTTANPPTIGLFTLAVSYRRRFMVACIMLCIWSVFPCSVSLAQNINAQVQVLENIINPINSSQRQLRIKISSGLSRRAYMDFTLNNAYPNRYEGRWRLNPGQSVTIGQVIRSNHTPSITSQVTPD